MIAVGCSGKPQFVPFSEVIDNRNYYGYLSTDDLNINNISIRKYNPEEKSQEFVDTEVSCVTVKSGYIVIRQNGLITIVGNCPGPYLFERANDICEKVNKKITKYNLQKKAEELANDNNTKNETPKTDDKKTDTTNKTSIKKYDLVKVASNAVYYTGKEIPSWVKSQNWYVASVSGDRVVLGKNEKKDRDIQSPVNAKYLTVVKKNTPANDTTEKSFTFTVKSTQYIYDTYASNRKVVSTIKPGVYTITDTEVVSGVKFGKLKSGAGWIQLSGSTTEPKELKVGSLVKLASNATYLQENIDTVYDVISAHLENGVETAFQKSLLNADLVSRCNVGFALASNEKSNINDYIARLKKIADNSANTLSEGVIYENSK